MIDRLMLSTQRQGKCDLCKSVMPITYDFIIRDRELMAGTLQTCEKCAVELSREFNMDAPSGQFVHEEFIFE